MKRINLLPQIFFLTAVIFLVVTRCKKNNTDSISYIRGNIDGVAFNCSKNIRANKPEPVPGSGGGADPNISITGEWPMFSIKLLIYGEGSSISTGDYVFREDKYRSATIVKNAVETFYAGPSGLFTPIHLYGSGRITILEINEIYVKGSFEFVTDGGPVITNGEFNVIRS